MKRKVILYVIRGPSLVGFAAGHCGFKTLNNGPRRAVFVKFNSK